jgi:hypothetical protein
VLKAKEQPAFLFEILVVVLEFCVCGERAQRERERERVKRAAFLKIKLSAK